MKKLKYVIPCVALCTSMMIPSHLSKASSINSKSSVSQILASCYVQPQSITNEGMKYLDEINESNVSEILASCSIQPQNLNNESLKYLDSLKESKESKKKNKVKKSESNTYSNNDKYLLAKISMSEAGGEDLYGKMLVVRVILNRVKSKKFPNTIEQVIYQNGQFSPISDGRFNSVEPSKECYEAIDNVINKGWDDSQGALYFESCALSNNWHSRNLHYLFAHGGHRFYK